jgi:GT2 family glycosyltransferase
LNLKKTDTPVPVVSIVIISYNTKALTLDCLASVYAETHIPFQVVVYDNASTDGSAEAIAERFPQAELIADSTNHGFGPAHKFAMQHVRAPWVLLLNPDTLVLDGAIDRLVAFAERTPEAGIWGGRTLYGDGSLNPTSCFARMTLWSLFCRLFGLNALFRGSAFFNSEYFGNWQRDTERQVDIVTGCFFLMRRADWDRLGGFDDAFVMYGEEVDLCMRGLAAGMEPRVTPEATIVHYGGASEKVQADKMIRLLRAKVLLIKRHFPAWQRSLALALFRLWPWSRIWAGYLGRGDAADWLELWRRRREWWHGWPEADTGLSPTVAGSHG